MAEINWKLETRKIKDLKKHPKNPRKMSKHDAEQLQKSLEKFGLIDKPIINADNTIIGGHQRISVLKKMGSDSDYIECYVPDRELSQEDVDELNLRLNRNNGEWDWDILGNEWDPTELIQAGFLIDELVGAEIEELSSLDGEDEEVLEPTKDPISKKGDLYQLGNHFLLCGDSTLPEDVTKLLNGAEPILMVTDPPYGVNYDPKWRNAAGKGTRALGTVQNDDQVNWALAWHLFPGSVAYVWHAGKYCGDVQASLKEAEFDVVSQIIWAKQHFALSRGDYHWQHEPCWYAVRKGHDHNWQGSRKESTIWEISNLNAFGKSQEEDERTAHSTQKPLECMAKPIRNNSAEGDSVYDPFGGSGTTLIAAERLNRACYMMELDPAYCDLIVNRWIKCKKKKDQDFKVIKNGELFEGFNG